MTELQKKVIDLSHKFKLSHLGSCLSAVDLIDRIYSVKKKDEPFILSQGHVGLALYVILEKYEKVDAEKLLEKHGTHPNRDFKNGIWCSTGSLGQGLPIGVGMALANKNRNVYVFTSDGEMAEGSCWEALRIAAENKLENLRITVNANGWSALGKVDADLLDLRLQYFYPTLVVKTDLFAFPDWLQGLQGHYKVMDGKEYGELSAGETSKEVSEKAR